MEFTNKKIHLKLRKVLSFTLVFALVFQAMVFGFLFPFELKEAQAANFTFVQTNWSGGATANNAAHPTNQTSWNEYTSTSSNSIITLGAGADLAIASTTAAVIETSNADFNAGTTSTTTVSANAVTLSFTSSPAWTAKPAWNAPDVGQNTRPELVDLDNDGDFDLMIGEHNGLTRSFENTGSVSSPTWTVKTAWDIGDVGALVAPYSADLDNDGDLDIMIGENAGVTKGYENTGSVSSPTWTAKTAWNVPDIGWTSAPAIADLDNDGDFDLMIGNWSGFTKGYENTGSVSSPIWTVKTAWDIGDVGNYIKPALADLDGDGDFDIMLGTSAGFALGYENTGSVLSPIWTAKPVWDSPSVGVSLAAPSFADLDNDGDLDIMIGENAGPVYGFENIPTTTYQTSGTFTSQSIDTGQTSTFTTLEYTKTTPTNTTLTMDARAGPTATPDGSWTSWSTGIANGGSISSLGTNRYVQYRANFTTTDTSATPTLDDVTVNYFSYTTTEQTLTSSAYDSSDSTNAMASMKWTETLPSNTDVKFQIRTAQDSAGSPGTYTSWLGPTGIGDYYTDSAGGETINSTHTDGASDQWFQYKVFLSSSDGASTPTLSDATVTYSFVTNATPTAPISGITGADDPIYAGVQYQLTSTSTDADGFADLDKMYFLIENPSDTDIEVYATEQGMTTSGTATTTSGAGFLIGNTTYSYSTTTDSIITTWTFKPDWDWTEGTLLEYGIKAIDGSAADSGYATTTLDVLYENDLDYSGTLAASGSVQGSIADGDWVQTGETVTFSGLSVVYQGGAVNPADTDFNIQITNDSTGSWTQSTSPTLSLAVTATSTTDISDIHNIDIVGIPTGGSDASTQTWTLKVDGTNPTNAGASTPADSATNVATSASLVALSATDANSGLHATPYYIELATDTGFSTGLQNSSWQSGTSWSPTLATDTTYYWRVKVRDVVLNESVGAGHTADTTGYGTFTTVPGVPTAPSSVSASRDSDTQFTTTWTDNSSNESAFSVERNTDTGGGFSGWAHIATTTANAVTFLDNSTNNPSDPPQADERYQYRARAYNVSGYSSYGTDSVTHYTTPGTPSGVAGAYVSDSQFTVSWTDNAAVEDTHGVERCDNAGCDTPTYLAITSSPFETSPQTDSTSIAADGRYRWRAQAQTPDSQNSSWAYSTYQYTTPSDPTSTSATYDSDTQFTVSWTDSSSYEDGFKVERKDEGGAWSQIGTASANATSYVDSTTATDKYYEYKTRSYKGSLNSVYNTDATLYYTKPSAPTIAAPTTVASSTAITWNWTDNSTYEDSFRVDYTVGTSTATDKDGIAANATSWQDTDLNPSTAYAVEVHAFRTDRGESTASATSTTVYTLANVPSSPAVAQDSQTQLTFSWGANSNGSGTEYYALNTTASTTSGWITATSWAETGLTAATTYTYKVKARNGAGTETAYSITAQGTTATAYACNDSTDNDGDGLTDYPNDPGCSSSTDDDETDPATTTGGGGVPGIVLTPPTQPTPTQDNPQGEFKVLINNDNTGTTDKNVTLNLFGGSDAKNMAISEDPTFASAVQEPYQATKAWVLSDGYGPKTIYVKFYTQYGQASGVVSDSIELKEFVLEEVVEEVPDIEDVPLVEETLVIEDISEVQPPVTEEKLIEQKSSSIETNKEEAVLEVVAPKAPEKDTAPLPKNIQLLIQKFPDLEKTFSEIGISKLDDIKRLKGVTFTLPSLAKVKGIPLANLSLKEKEALPKEIIFASSKDEKIGLDVSLIFDEEGNTKQQINAILGKTLSLSIKPENAVNSIKGYITLKLDEQSSGLKRLLISLKASVKSIFLINPSFAQEETKQEERFVLVEFEYTDPDGDGIYTTNVAMPKVAGEYDVITVLDYRDPALGTKEIKMTTVVDPEGYIYENVKGKELRIEGATASMYWLNEDTQRYVLWPASEYSQQNNQVTTKTGQYSFLVPKGKYYLEVKAEGYKAYTSEAFDVTSGVGVHMNIELKPKYVFLSSFDWKLALLILVTLLLFYNFYRDRKRGKTVFRKEK